MRAATLWRRVLGCEFALAIGAAWSLWNLGQLPASMVLPAAVGVFLLVQCLLVAASTVAGRVLAEAVEPTQAFATARAIAQETLHFTCMQLAMSVQSGVHASEQNTTTRGGRPILLVHGLVCNRGVWWMLRRRLRAAGFGCVHVVARAMLRLPGSVPIHHLITLATPHGGASLARALDWPCTRQMRPGSEWLARLNAHTADSRTEPRTTCFYSSNDNLVAPANSAALPGAAHVEVSGLGHFGLLISRRVGNLLIGALREGA